VGLAYGNGKVKVYGGKTHADLTIREKLLDIFAGFDDYPIANMGTWI
jgi:hypothetical protein